MTPNSSYAADTTTEQPTDTGLPADIAAHTDERTGPPNETIAKDDGFHLLQNSRRRAVLRYLLERPERDRFRMRTVAEALAAWEHDTTVEQLNSDQRQRVYIALYQSHLPKLDTHDVIDYDQSRGIIEPQPLLQAFVPFLEDGLDVADDEFVTPQERAGGEDSSAGGVTERILGGLMRT